MKLRSLAGALAALLFAVSLAVAVGTGVWWPAMGIVGVGSLGIGLMGLSGGIRALALLGRYLYSDRVAGTARFDEESEWVKLEGAAHAEETVDTALGGPSVAHDVRIRTKETLRGTSRPGTLAGTVVTERTGVPFTLHDGRALDVDPGEGPRVVGTESPTLFGPDATPPQSLRRFLDAGGASFEKQVFDGRVFRHSLHVEVQAVRPGDSVRLFGKVAVATDGNRPSLRPVPGSFGSLVLTNESWSAVRNHLVRRSALGLGLSSLYAAFGTVVLWSLAP